MERILALTNRMVKFYRGDPARIQHFIKVRDFAVHIGRCEKLSERELYILEAAALVHDIGIRPAEELYGKGNCGGSIQEKLGPPEAEMLMAELGFDGDAISRVSYLVGHHHTYSNIDGMDYRILVEADFLVNLFEGNSEKSGIISAMNSVFATESGTMLLKTMFDI